MASTGEVIRTFTKSKSVKAVVDALGAIPASSCNGNVVTSTHPRKKVRVLEDEADTPRSKGGPGSLASFPDGSAINDD